MAALRFEVRSDECGLAQLKPHWDELWQAVNGAYFSQSYDWCRASWTARGRQSGHRLHCLVGWDGNSAVLIWPFEIYRRAVWTICRPLGTAATEYTDVLVEDAYRSEEHIASALDLLCRSCRSDIISLPHIPRGSQLKNVLSLLPKPATRDRAATSALMWRDCTDWQSYLDSRKRANRQDINRRRRRLNEQGRVSFAALNDGDDFESVLSWIFEHKVASLAMANRRSAWRDTASYVELLSSAARSRSTGGGLIIFTLRLDAVLVAAELARADKVRIERLVPTYDRKYARFAPGILLLQDLLQWAFDRRLDVDFRIGADAYKEHWVNWRGEVVSYEIANTLVGRGYFLARGAWRALKQRS